MRPLSADGSFLHCFRYLVKITLLNDDKQEERKKKKKEDIKLQSDTP